MKPIALICFVTLAACGPSSPGAHNEPDAGDDPSSQPDAGVRPQPGSLKLTPSVQDYGNVIQGSSAAAILQVVNPGGQSVGGVTAAVSGPDAAAFAIQPGGC